MTTGSSGNQDDGELLRQLLLEKYEPIAIVGVGMRLPGGNDSRESLGDFLRAGSSGIGPIPASRWDVAGLSSDTDPVEKGKIGTTAGGFIEDIDQFDPTFFGISPKEADYIDPQQRLLMEVSWEALEDAGLDATSLRGVCGGVYVGISSADYMVATDELPWEELDGYLGTGTAHSAASGRLSYFLGWQGPCVSVDTACSSSLVALHMAVQDLRQHQADLALCAAVGLVLHPQAHIVTSQANMLAPDGRCKTFDESADGYSRSEGCGVLALKRMTDAKRDGDRILALVRGSAIRQDGESGGLTVPNGKAQQRVMRAALDNSGLRPADVHYVEAHGTGTAVGDPIEVDAIARVFSASHDRENPMLIGSVKTNLGHSEPAAGVSGLIKALLQLDEQWIYPHLNLSTPSSRIAWRDIPVTVPTEGRSWPAASTRRALVNSFGFAGTIASAVIEQAPPRTTEPTPVTSGPGMFTLSAHTRKALRGQVRRYRRYLDDHPSVDIAELCHATNVNRAHLSARVAGQVSNRAELLALLDRHADETPAPRQPRKIAFLFTGQGAQYSGMGADLYRRHRIFADAVDECDRLFAERLDGMSIAALMLGSETTDPELLGQTRFTQPALFTLEYALNAVWNSWGIYPDALIGHSIGEVVAGTVAGVFSLPDAVALVSTRARLMQSVTTPGGMLAVRAQAAEVEPLLAAYPDLSLAAINAPDQCVVSGGRDSLAAVAAELEARGVRAKPLPVSHAFHSPLMDEVTGEFRATLDRITFGEPRIPLVSNLTGRVADADELCRPEYWVRQIREPVDFASGVATIAHRGKHAMLEIGPGRTLVNAGRQCVPTEEHLWLASLSSPDGTPLEAAGQLYMAGLPVDWAGVHENRPKPWLTLPSYAFDRKSYWLPDKRKPVSSGTAHPLLGTEVSTVDQIAAGVREFAATINARQPGYLEDHQVTGQVVFPAAGFVEVLIAAEDAIHGDTRRPIEGLVIHEALFLTTDACTLCTRVRRTEDGRDELRIFSEVNGIERLHVTATAVPVGDTVAGELLELSQKLAESGQRALTTGSPVAGGVDELYADFAESEMRYGPRFRLIREFVRHGEDLSVAELQGPADVPAEHLPPAVLDAALQSLATVVQPGLPVRFRAFQLLSRPRGVNLRSVIRLRKAGDESDVDYVADVVVLDGERTVCVLTGLELRHVARSPGSRRQIYHELRWSERDTPEPDARPRHLVLLRSGIAGVEEDQALAARAAETGTRLSFADDLGRLPVLLAEQPTDVCWFWRSVDAELPDELEQQHTELLELARLLEQHGQGQRLWLFTHGAQLFPGEPAGDLARLAAATAWGYGTVVANEYPTYRATMVDLPAGAGDDLVTVLDECRSGPENELQVAYRDGQRYVRRLEPSDPAERPAPEQAGKSPVDGDHNYLITGGLGGLGLATARTLVDLGARYITLVSRQDPDEQRLRSIRAELGDEVAVECHSADIAEAGQVTALFEKLAANALPLGGVVHAAGLLADKPINKQDWHGMDKVFRAKVYGSWLLHQATADLPDLRFFVGYASSSTVFGQAGQVNYAAGNAFLDALMHWRVASGLPGVSIDWGPWDEIGMATGLSDQRRSAYLRQGMRFVHPREGRRALATLLERPAPQVIVGECDWTTFAGSRPLPNVLYELLARPAQHSAIEVDVELLRALPTADRAEQLAGLVRSTLAEVLHFDSTDEIALETAFPNLGLDSLVAVEVKNKLESALHTGLPMSVTFDYPTTGELVSYLDNLLVPDVAENDNDGWNVEDAQAELAALKELGG